MPFPRKRLRQYIRYHVFRWAILQAYLATLQLLSNEVMLHINVLCTSVMCGILRKRDAPLVVTHDGD